MATWRKFGAYAPEIAGLCTTAGVLYLLRINSFLPSTIYLNRKRISSALSVDRAAAEESTVPSNTVCFFS